MKKIVPIALAAILAVVVAGCGGGDPPSVAAVDTTPSDTTGDGDGARAAKADPQEQALAWARCMRKNGIDVADPDENGMAVITPDTAMPSVDDEDFKEAEKECGSPLAGGAPPELSESDKRELQESMLAFARCMREEGIELPDPEVGEGGGIAITIGGEVDPTDPDFQAAQKVCAKHMRGLMPGAERSK